MFDSLEEFESWFDIPKYLHEEDDYSSGKINSTTSSSSHSNVNGSDELMIKTLIEGLHSVLKPFLLRRYKSQVVHDLVPKTEYTLLIEPTKMQRELFFQILDSNTPISNRVMQLRKVCNHPLLFTESKCSDELKWEDEKCTNKIPLFIQLLKRLIKEKHSVLVFSQMTRMLDILEDILKPEFTVYRLDGTTPMEERSEMVKGQSKCQVFLLSTRAGGLGLNLSSFDTVIFYDSDWVSSIHLSLLEPTS